mmetsp:Transcript_27706/g.41062  ORF Transcript_27706/g.41062 Transcript_27706/m.41062 type:complete len:201 (-) Transcript_27706:94-696(-)
MLSLANHVLHCTVSKLSHGLTNLFSHQEEVVHYVLGLPRKLLSQLLILGCNSYWACIQVTLAHHDTSQSNEGSSGETVFLGSEKTRNDDITSSLQLTISLKFDSVTKSVEYKSLLRLCKTKFPRETCTLQSSPSSSSSSSVMSTNDNVVRKSLCNSSGYNSNTDLRYKFDRYLTMGLGILQVVNELGKILDRVDIVVRWW